MRESIEVIKQQVGDIGSSEWTANSMAQAPVTVLIFNAYAAREPGAGPGDVIWNVVDVQSIGAAIQNMLLAAQEGVRSRSWALYGLWGALCGVCILVNGLGRCPTSHARFARAEPLGCVLVALSGPLRGFASRPATISPGPRDWNTLDL